MHSVGQYRLFLHNIAVPLLQGLTEFCYFHIEFPEVPSGKPLFPLGIIVLELDIAIKIKFPSEGILVTSHANGLDTPGIKWIFDHRRDCFSE